MHRFLPYSCCSRFGGELMDVRIYPVSHATLLPHLATRALRCRSKSSLTALTAQLTHNIATMATAAASRDPDLVSALTARNATFATLLSLIPQQYYVGPSEEQLDSRWMKNKKRKTGEEIKEHKRRVKQDKVSEALEVSEAAGRGPKDRGLACAPPSPSLVRRGCLLVYCAQKLTAA